MVKLPGSGKKKSTKNITIGRNDSPPQQQRESPNTTSTVKGTELGRVVQEWAQTEKIFIQRTELIVNKLKQLQQKRSEEKQPEGLETDKLLSDNQLQDVVNIYEQVVQSAKQIEQVFQQNYQDLLNGDLAPAKLDEFNQNNFKALLHDLNQSMESYGSVLSSAIDCYISTINPKVNSLDQELEGYGIPFTAEESKGLKSQDLLMPVVQRLPRHEMLLYESTKAAGKNGIEGVSQLQEELVTKIKSAGKGEKKADNRIESVEQTQTFLKGSQQSQQPQASLKEPQQPQAAKPQTLLFSRGITQRQPLKQPLAMQQPMAGLDFKQHMQDQQAKLSEDSKFIGWDMQINEVSNSCTLKKDNDERIHMKSSADNQNLEIATASSTPGADDIAMIINQIQQASEQTGRKDFEINQGTDNPEQVLALYQQSIVAGLEPNLAQPVRIALESSEKVKDSFSKVEELYQAHRSGKPSAMAQLKTLDTKAVAQEKHGHKL